MSLAFDARFDRPGASDRPVAIVRLVVAVVSLLVLHGLLFRRLRIGGVGPEFFLALAVLGGVELGVAGGAALGLLAGVAQDMTATTSVGVWAFVGGVVGFAMGLVHERAYTDSLRRPPFVLVAVMTAVALGFGVALGYVIDGAPFPAPVRFARLLVLSALWGVVITLPVRRLLRVIVGRSL
jgi:cell shape-determining protein MreD